MTVNLHAATSIRILQKETVVYTYIPPLTVAEIQPPAGTRNTATSNITYASLPGIVTEHPNTQWHHPALLSPTSDEHDAFIAILKNTSGRKILPDAVWKISYTATHAADGSRESQSNKLQAIYNSIASSIDRVYIAAGAYQVALQWANYRGERLSQASKILWYAAQVRDIYYQSDDKTAAVKLLAKSMAELSNGLARRTDLRLQDMHFAVESLRCFLDKVEYGADKLLSTVDIVPELQTIHANLQGLMIPPIASASEKRRFDKGNWDRDPFDATRQWHTEACAICERLLNRSILLADSNAVRLDIENFRKTWPDIDESIVNQILPNDTPST